MSDYRLRDDLTRSVIDGFAFPLGIVPGEIKPPTQGYTIAYNPGEDDDPDTYTFHIVVSHERVASVLEKAFSMLPGEVYGIVEINSRDAYRAIDVYVARESVPCDDLLITWKIFENVLLEDAAIAAGANSEDPFIEVFLDQWKGISIIIPLDLRDKIEEMLNHFDLEEVPQTWPLDEENQNSTPSITRSVIDLDEEASPDIDDMLWQMRYDWRLELRVDPSTNVDDAGKELGLTLWRAIIGAESADRDSDERADVVIWATADSLEQLEQFVIEAFKDHKQWILTEVFAVDRVALDERPDTLTNLELKQTEAKVHIIEIEPWSDDEANSEDGSEDSSGDE